MDVSKAMKYLRWAMKNDPEYAWSWHCNLAMMACDAGATHAEANKQAASFMKATFGVDITKTHYWKNLWK